jgi:RND family efflux transporter MFP subunit
MSTKSTEQVCGRPVRRRHGSSDWHVFPRGSSPAAGIFALLLLAGLGVTTTAQDAATGQIAAVPAQAASYQPEFRGYARVAPIQMVTVKVGLKGVIEDLAVRPGQRLSAGDAIARVGGPDQEEAIKEAQAQLSAARQTYAAASDAEQAVRDTYPKFADRAQLDRAKAELAAAEAGVADARAELARVQALSTIVSPASGQVVSLPAANGDQVVGDSPVLVLQPDHDLWLRAIFYDAPTDLLTPGRSARFLPAGGAKGLAVRLAQLLPSLRPDGGLTAFFEAVASAPRWKSGEAGEVVIAGASRDVVAVPTEALVLDQGRWWVLEKTGGHLRNTPVEIGPSKGHQTLVLSGLAAGDEVVVRDAYLLFHRKFGQHYTPPD